MTQEQIDATTPATTKSSRPKTCGALFVTSPELGSKGCHRLPRHKGDHRATLTLAAGRRAATAKMTTKSSKGRKQSIGRATKAERKLILAELRESAGIVGRKRAKREQRRVMLAELASRVASGTLRAGDALGIAALV